MGIIVRNMNMSNFSNVRLSPKDNNKVGIESASYVEFLNFLDSGTINITNTWGGYSWHRYKVRPASGNMYGSTFRSWYMNNGQNHMRQVQHAFYDHSSYVYNLENQMDICCYYQRGTSDRTFPRVNRNGYHSLSHGSAWGSRMLWFMYYDPEVNDILEYNPFSSASVPRVWTRWSVFNY